MTFFRRTTNVFCNVNKEYKGIRERISQCKIKTTGFLFLVDLRDNSLFKIVIATTHSMMIAYV